MSLKIAPYKNDDRSAHLGLGQRERRETTSRREAACKTAIESSVFKDRAKFHRECEIGESEASYPRFCLVAASQQRTPAEHGLFVEVVKPPVLSKSGLVASNGRFFCSLRRHFDLRRLDKTTLLQHHRSGPAMAVTRRRRQRKRSRLLAGETFAMQYPRTTKLPQTSWTHSRSRPRTVYSWTLAGADKRNYKNRKC